MGLVPAAATPAPAAAPAASRPPQLAAVPWAASLRGFASPLVQLHREVVELCRYLAPSPAEAAARREAIDRVADVVRSIWPSARVEVFGSFATGLYLPTSDIDAVVLGSGCTNIPAGLKALATAMARRSMTRNMQVIAKARVPIVKFEEAESGYNFDVSFDVANGPEAAGSVRAMMDALPPMRPLVMVLKVFLQQRELNEVYSGGVGSYALLVMVASFLQTHPSRAAAPAARAPGRLDDNLGALLLDFLRLYGRALANTHVGVSCRRGGGFFAKRDRGFHNAERPYLLAVEDPADAANDLGKNSYNVSRVRMAFDYAYCQLVAPAAPGESLLQRVVRLDPVLFLRAPPAAVPGGEREREGGSRGEATPPVEGGRNSKKDKAKKDRGRAAAAEEAPAQRPGGKRKAGRADDDGDGGGAGRGKPKRRRHRERSASDEELGGRARSRAADSDDSGGGKRHRSRRSPPPPPKRKSKGGKARGHTRFD
jgi:non-canonical poly(A) RNA polymerase PAPD5/7